MKNTDPTNPTDILGQPIAEGDVVAWALTCGRSGCLSIAVIEKIIFKCKGGNGSNMKCTQLQAESYSLTLRHIETTSYTSFVHRQTGVSEYRSSTDRKQRPEDFIGSKGSTGKVENIIKLNITEQEVYDAIRS